MQISALRPSRRFISVTLAFAVCGIGSWGGAAWADEKNRDEPEVVKPVELGGTVGRVGPIGVENAPNRALPVAPIGSLAPMPAAGSVSAIPALGSVGDVGKIGFNLSAMERDTALIQIKAGALTMEEAWQSGALTYDNIVDLLEHPADPWLVNIRKTDDGLNHQLIALLLQHEEAKLKDLPKVPKRVRLWLADYYQSQRNEKVVEVAESIVVEHQQPTQGSQDIVFQALERQAWFYRDQRKYELSAEAWKRVPSYVTNTEWMIPDAYVEASLVYYELGDFVSCATYAQKSLEVMGSSPNANVLAIATPLLTWSKVWSKKSAFLPEFDWILIDDDPYFECAKPILIYCLDSDVSISVSQGVIITSKKQIKRDKSYFSMVKITLDRVSGIPMPEIVHLTIDSKTTGKRQVIALQPKCSNDQPSAAPTLYRLHH